MHPDRIDVARHARSKCAQCREVVDTGAMRFGEVVGTKRDKPAYIFYHLACAAPHRSEKVALALVAHTEPFDGRAELAAMALRGVAASRVARIRGARRAVNAQALCKVCDGPVAKGSLCAYVDWIDNPTNPHKGTIHATCAVLFAGETVVERLREDLGEADREALRVLLHAVAVLDASERGRALEGALGDPTEIVVLSDWLEEEGVVISLDELRAAVAARALARKRTRPNLRPLAELLTELADL